MPTIGILIGRERSFPEALAQEVARQDASVQVKLAAAVRDPEHPPLFTGRDGKERLMPPDVLWLIRVVGAIALVLDIEIDNLAIILAVALGGIAGEEVAGALTLAHYEREHGGTVYRVEDPVGTEAGLAWQDD